MDVVVRQNHPGEDVPPYSEFASKMRDADRYRREEQTPWAVVVDDLQGTTHQAYGGMADPSYLIDRNGRVSFYNMWTHVPTLYVAIKALLAQSGEGVVNGGIDHGMHFAPAMTAGWPSIQRGLPQSHIDLETAVPGMGASLWLGYKLRKVLAPFTQREKPLPRSAKTILLAIGVGAAVLLGRKVLAVRTGRLTPAK